jgi:hypothetical protein
MHTHSHTRTATCSAVPRRGNRAQEPRCCAAVASPQGAEVDGEASGASDRSSSEHLSIMSPPEGSDVENVLQLICNIFQLPVALVAAYR